MVTDGSGVGAGAGAGVKTGEGSGAGAGAGTAGTVVAGGGTADGVDSGAGAGGSVIFPNKAYVLKWTIWVVTVLACSFTVLARPWYWVPS